MVVLYHADKMTYLCIGGRTLNVKYCLNLFRIRFDSFHGYNVTKIFYFWLCKHAFIDFTFDSCLYQPFANIPNFFQMLFLCSMTYNE
jgi:hypothetical protein